MHRSFLTVDLGNTRCKLRRWSVDERRAARLDSAVELENRAGILDLLRRWLEHEPRIDSAALCSVGRPELEAEMWETLARHVVRAGDRALDPGLVIECREPSAVGRDRLFSARAAFEILHQSAIVVDAGTALTVDAIASSRERGGRPRFLGGAIAPGPKLLAQALSAGTAQLPLVDPAPGVPALGRDTVGAIRAGIGVGFRGAARELVSRLSLETETGVDAPVALTGGASSYLIEPSVFAPRRVIVEPELVHFGLLAASGIQLPAQPAAR